jgi:uncharacterized protein YecT (DUF1311 family)
MHKVLMWLSVMCMISAARADDPTGGFFDDTAIPCPGASSEVAWGQCNHDALARADRELNALYQQLIALADDNQQAHLREMQRAWIKLRDAQCAFVVDYHAGAANPGKFGTHCAAVMTIRRAWELQQLGTGLAWRQRG